MTFGGGHDRGEPEANITSAVRDFLILTGLARSEEMIEENPSLGRVATGRGLDRVGHLHRVQAAHRNGFQDCGAAAPDTLVSPGSAGGRARTPAT